MCAAVYVRNWFALGGASFVLCIYIRKCHLLRCASLVHTQYAMRIKKKMYIYIVASLRIHCAFKGGRNEHIYCVWLAINIKLFMYLYSSYIIYVYVGGGIQDMLNYAPPQLMRNARMRSAVYLNISTLLVKEKAILLNF